MNMPNYFGRRMLKKRNGVRDSPTLDPLITSKAGTKSCRKAKGPLRC